MTRRFTGVHMGMVMVAMFGTIITVNLVMARYAVATFGGVVVENSYVASQRFNGWLAEARAQEALGWSRQVGVDHRRFVHIALHGSGAPLDGAVVSVLATHPLGRKAPRALRFVRGNDGGYVSDSPIGPGRWLLRIEVRQDRRTAFFDDQVAS